MARYCGKQNSKPILTAADLWRQQCAQAGGAVFSDDSLWNAENFQALEDYFVNNLDEGEGDFFTKLESQLASTAPVAKKLAAELTWLMLLCPSNIRPKKKRESVIRVWQWSGDRLDEAQPLLSEETLGGIGSGGVSFNTNRWREFAYAINVFSAFFKLRRSERERLLSDVGEFTHWLENIDEN